MSRPQLAIVLATAMLGLLLAGPTVADRGPNVASAQDTPADVERAVLKWKFEPNASFKYGLTQKTVSKTIDRGRDISRDTTLKTDFSVKVLSATPDGGARVTVTYTRVQFTQESPLLPEGIRFDSDKDEDQQRARFDPALMPFALLDGAAFTLTVTAAGEVTRVEGSEAFVAELTKDMANPAFDGVKAAIERQYSAESMKVLFSSHFHVVTGADQKPGDTWSRTFSNEVDGVGTVKVTRDHTLSRLVRDAAGDLIAVIGISAKYEVEEKTTDTTLIPGFTLTGEITAGDVTGEIRFNLAKGRPGSVSIREAFTTKLSATPADADSAALAFEAVSEQTGETTLESVSG